MQEALFEALFGRIIDTMFAMFFVLPNHPLERALVHVPDRVARHEGARLQDDGLAASNLPTKCFI